MSSGPVEVCAVALDAFYTATESDDTQMSLPLMRALDKLLVATRELIAECRRAQDEGDWA